MAEDLMPRIAALLEARDDIAFAGWERDPVRVAAAEHFLQVAIQAVIDICAHMTSERGLNGDFHRFIAHVLQTEMFRSTDKKHNA